MDIDNVFLIAPIIEFHQYTPDIRLTDALFRALQNSLQWAEAMLNSNNVGVITILDAASFPLDASASEVRYLMSTREWNESFMASADKIIDAVDAIALMPDVKEVRSPLMERIRDMAAEKDKPEIDAFAAAGIDDGDFRKNLLLIDDASMHARERSKIIMRGGRGR